MSDEFKKMSELGAHVRDVIMSNIDLINGDVSELNLASARISNAVLDYLKEPSGSAISAGATVLWPPVPDEDSKFFALKAFLAMLSQIRAEAAA